MGEVKIITKTHPVIEENKSYHDRVFEARFQQKRNIKRAGSRRVCQTERKVGGKDCGQTHSAAKRERFSIVIERHRLTPPV